MQARSRVNVPLVRSSWTDLLHRSNRQSGWTGRPHFEGPVWTAREWRAPRRLSDDRIDSRARSGDSSTVHALPPFRSPAPAPQLAAVGGTPDGRLRADGRPSPEPAPTGGPCNGIVRQ